MRKREGIAPDKPERENIGKESLPPPIPELKEREGVQIIEHQYGPAHIREYVDRSVYPYGRTSGKPEEQIDALVPEIELITKQGKTFRLSTELPKGYKFVRLDVETVPYEDPGKRFIVYGKEDAVVVIDDKGDTFTVKANACEYSGWNLGIEHEIGHGFKNLKLSKKELARRAYLRRRQKNLTANEKEEYIKTVFQDERDAWAHALRRLHELRVLDFDLEPELDLKHIEEIVHVNLYDYEVLLRGARPLPDLKALIRGSLRPKKELKR